MQITWHGINCIRIQGKDVTILMDPFSDNLGPKLPRWQADIVTASSDDIDTNKGGVGAFIIENPGEYEIKGAFIYGLPWKKEKTGSKSVLFRVNVEGISFAHLGSLDRNVPNSALEILEDVDVLFLPVGDPDLLSVKEALEVISRIEPRIVIPISIKSKGVKKKLNTADDFIKQLGIKAETVDKLKLQQKDLPETERLVYLFEAS